MSLRDKKKKSAPKPPRPSNDPSQAEGLAIAIPQSMIDAMMMTASMAYQTNHLEQALDIYKGVELARPKWSRPLVGKGSVFFKQANLDEAEGCYKAALALNPKDQDARLYLGEFLWQARGEQKTATEHLKEAFRIDPKSLSGARAQVVLQMIEKKR